MDDKGKRDYIVNIFMYNGTIEDDGSTYTIIDQGSIVCEYELVKTSTLDVLEEILVFSSKPTTNGSYTPRNKKLLTYPYCYLLVNNMAGTSKMYKYEDFYVEDISFKKSSIVSVGGSSVYYPIGYKQGYTWSREVNVNEGFVGAKFPVCSWTSDAYTNWLTQKAVDVKYRTGYRVAQTIASAAALGGGIATGNPALIAIGGSGLTNVATSAVNDVIGDMQQKEEHSIAPMEIEGMSSAGDVVYAYNRCKPEITPMYIRREYCEVIDKFFDQYGYKVNILKTPNIHTRRYWNFLKTKNCNFTGNIPQEYMVRIKSIFDAGITFWHDPSKMFDYSQTNSVLS